MNSKEKWNIRWALLIGYACGALTLFALQELLKELSK